MRIEIPILHTKFKTNCYIIGNKWNNKALIIDPADNLNEIVKSLENLKLKPIAVILTHYHFDHRIILNEILKKFKIPLWYNDEDCDIINKTKANRTLKDNEILRLGRKKIKVFKTPGHTSEGICLYIKKVKCVKTNKRIEGAIITGDIIFIDKLGRWKNADNFKELFNSLKIKLLWNSKFKKSYQIFPGHKRPFSIKWARNIFIIRNLELKHNFKI